MKNVIPEVIAYLFVLLFLYTGISKLIEYSIFKEQIALAPLFRNNASLIAIALPITEILFAALLFWPAWRLIGLYASLGLMILFTSYIIYILNVDERLPCSCGGFIEALSWKQHIIFNCIMILLASIGILFLRRGRLTDDNHFLITKNN